MGAHTSKMDSRPLPGWTGGKMSAQNISGGTRPVILKGCAIKLHGCPARKNNRKYKIGIRHCDVHAVGQQSTVETLF
jgi:hypothetical protein